jgi:hypothetical protein
LECSARPIGRATYTATDSSRRSGRAGVDELGERLQLLGGSHARACATQREHVRAGGF